MIKKIFCNYLSKFLPPLFLQKLKVGDVYICSLNDRKEQADSIFANIACGVHFSWEGAIIRAQSEYVERKSVQSLGAKSATGFAAYPFIFRKKRAEKKARFIAYMEMVERYAWPEWWENKNIGYCIKNSVSIGNKSFFHAIEKEFFLDLRVIIPHVAEKNLKLVILYAQIKEGLVCAAAVNTTEEQAEQRALKELYMHALGLYRMKKYNMEPCSLYEKRIDWISKQKTLLEKRLTFQGDQSIEILFPVIFQDIKTEFYKSYVVQRCIFDKYNESFADTINKMYI